MIHVSKKKLIVFALLAATASACAATEEFDRPSDPDRTSTEPSAVSTPALHGLYHWDAPNGPRMVDEVAKWLGRPADLGMAFSPANNWTDMAGPAWQLRAWRDWVKATPGRRFVYALPLLPGPVNGSGPDRRLGTADDVSLQQCSDGKYDRTWTTLANNLVAYGLQQTILRVGWEFDGDWFAWRASGKEAQFAGCFRRVVSAMRAAQASAGFKFDWNPDAGIRHWSDAQINAAWPGDGYVDYVGVDIYDASWKGYPYPSPCSTECRLSRQTSSWTDISEGLYKMRDFAVAHGKLVSLPEWGVWSRSDGTGGGDDPFYIEQMHAFIANPANRVGYEMYFDVNWTDGDHQLSDVDGTGNSLSAPHSYKTLFPLAAARYKALFGPNWAAPLPAPAPAPAPTTTAVALSNPGFETQVSGWRPYGSASTVSTGQYLGGFALRIGSASGGAEQAIMSKLQLGATYTLTAYGKVQVSSEVAALGIKFLGASGQTLQEQYAMIYSTDYTRAAIDFTVPSDAVSATIYAYKATSASTYAWFDEFALARRL
jgi:hypothetical protein